MKLKFPAVIKKVVFNKDIEKIIVVFLTVVLAALTAIMVMKSADRDDSDVLSGIEMEEFVFPPEEKEEVIVQQRLIEKWEKPAEFIAYPGLVKRDFFTERGRIDSGTEEPSYLLLSILYQGTIKTADGDLRAQINWEEGKKLRTYFVQVGEFIRGYEILEIVPREKVRMKTPGEEEITLEYKKKHQIEKLSGGI